MLRKANILVINYIMYELFTYEESHGTISGDKSQFLKKNRRYLFPKLVNKIQYDVSQTINLCIYDIFAYSIVYFYTNYEDQNLKKFGYFFIRTQFCILNYRYKSTISWR